MKITPLNAKISLVISLIVIVVLALQIPKLSFDYELENFFPIGDADLDFYKKHSDKFGSDNDFILLAIESKKGVFDSVFLNQAHQLSNTIKRLKGTNEVISLTHLKRPIKTPMGLMEIPYLHLKQSEKLSSDSVKLAKEPHLLERFISKDGLNMKIIIQHQKFESKNLADLYVVQVNQLCENYHFDHYRLAGKAVAQTAYISAIQKDFSRFLVISSVTILIMLIIFIRRASMIAASLLISIIAVVVTLGLMAVMGKKIDVLTTLIPSILLVVSMSDVIHLFAGIQFELQKGQSPTEAINQAIRKIGLATFLTSFTTAVGFLTLITINVKPIIDLGIYAAVGILVAFTLTYSCFPQIILLLKPQLVQKRFNQSISLKLGRLFLCIAKYRKSLVLGFVLSLLPISYGIYQIDVDAYLIEDLPKDDYVKQDFIFFDQQFGGTKPLILNLSLTDTTQTFWNPAVIQELDRIETATRKIQQTTYPFSIVAIIKSAHQSLHGGLASAYQLPTDEQDWNQTIHLSKKIIDVRPDLKLIVGHETQIFAFAKDKGSKESLLRNTALEKEVFGKQPKHIQMTITGTSPLIDKSQGLLSYNLIKGLLLAIVIVGILAGMMFRSWRMILITLIPNILPILATAALMGYMGIHINLSTSIIFAISFGIVVDDSIHFLSKFRLSRQAGISNLVAIKRTIIETGEPIIITTLVLTAGFCVFCFSNFGATFHTGLFVSTSFIIALIADLLLLPILILLFLPNKSNEKKSRK